ncbi:MAG: phosphatase PAP2 family protein [Clostridiaceae bacterium]
MQFINSIDVTIMSFVRDYFKSDFLDFVMVWATNLGEAGGIWVVASIGLMFSKKYRYIGITLFLTLAVSGILTEFIVKNIVQRPRPSIFIDSSNLLISMPKSYSFPSGHTATSVASALVLGYYFRKYKLYFYSLAATISFSRIYLFVHYPSDVLGGFIFGVFSYKLTTYLLNKYYPSDVDLEKAS